MVSVPAPPDSRLFSGRRAKWWRRVPHGRGFRFLQADGRPVKDPKALERIQGLKMPPAWKDVRICPHPRSRLQAVGLDGAGRPQYVYHPAYVARQQAKKFDKMEHFGERLPHLREVTSQHLNHAGLGRERVLGLVLRLVNELYFRPGSEVGRQANHTFGITTLRKSHVRIEEGGRLAFRFPGKHHVPQRHLLVDPAIAELVRELKAVPGPRLFQWLDADGRAHAVRDRDANAYLKTIMGRDYTLKDFRTWHGTLLVARELARIGPAETKTATRRGLNEAVKAAAARLGNTPAVCRRAYLHPMVVELYQRGFTLVDVPLEPGPIEANQAGFRPEEMQILELFAVGRRLKHAQRHGRQRQNARPRARPVIVPQPMLVAAA